MWTVWHIPSCLCDSSIRHQNSRNTPNKIKSIQDGIQIQTEEHFCKNAPKSANLHRHHVFTGFYSLSVWIMIALPLDLKPCPSPYAHEIQLRSTDTTAGAKPPCKSMINQLQIDQKYAVLQQAARRFPRRGGGTWGSPCLGLICSQRSRGTTNTFYVSTRSVRLYLLCSLDHSFILLSWFLGSFCRI